MEIQENDFEPPTGADKIGIFRHALNRKDAVERVRLAVIHSVGQASRLSPSSSKRHLLFGVPRPRLETTHPRPMFQS
jgi:hypothetical protein